MTKRRSRYQHIAKEELIEAIAANKSMDEIADEFDIERGSLSGILKRHGISTPRRVLTKPPKPPQSQPRPVYAIVTPEQAAYLREHYGTVPRSQLARALGVDKVTVNNMILQLRLGS